MPQPLNRVLPKAGGKITSFEFNISSRPEFSALICEAISHCAHIEFNLVMALSLMINSEHQVALTMFSAVTSQDAQRSMIKAVAQESLDAKYLAIFLDLLKAIRPAQTRRNEFSHHIWTELIELPDALLLIDPKDLLPVSIAISKTASGTAKPTELPSSKIMVYRKKDFDDSVSICFKAREATRLFWNLLAIEKNEKLTSPLPLTIGVESNSEKRARLSAYFRDALGPQHPSKGSFR